MAAMGKDYLACTAARSGAGCTNGKSIRRSRVEEVVLDGLKSRLMAPELVAEFIGAFHQELNRKHAADDAKRAADEQELGRVKKTSRGLYDAIADGLRSPGLQQELLSLESRQAQLTACIAGSPFTAAISSAACGHVSRSSGRSVSCAERP